MTDPAKRLTYRAAVRMAPVAYLDGEMVTIEGRCHCWSGRGVCGYLYFVPVEDGYRDGVALPSHFTLPNAAARRLMEVMR